MFTDITYVTALIDLRENNPDGKSIETRLDYFNQLQETDIHIHLFLSPEFKDKVTLKNGVIEYITLEELKAYQNTPSEKTLPSIRHPTKDTRNFLILMNSKTEFVRKAIDYGHSSTHYSWIDFSILHVFKNPVETMKYLKNYQLPDKCLYIPGCLNNSFIFFDQVNWRFCGGFFIGDKQSLLDFDTLHSEIYQSIPILTWEVNVWAFMETQNWKPDWFLADHNDSIIKIH